MVTAARHQSAPGSSSSIATVTANASGPISSFVRCHADRGADDAAPGVGAAGPRPEAVRSRSRTAAEGGAFRNVFTPEAWAQLSVMPGFGRALDADYLFIDAAGNPRVALPRRSTDFERLINSGNIFEGVTRP